MTLLQQRLAEQVRRGMEAHGLTQRELAERVGVGENHLSNMLRGKKEGSLTTWDAILRAVAKRPDPTHGRIDRDIQEQVDAMKPSSLGQRVALENTFQTLKERGR